VSDTGIGIAPEDIQKLFLFFGKLESSKKVNKGGMGLGLTISRMIIL
jgi:signal transduction histidine kinase